MDNLHHTCRALRALAPINGSHSHKEHCFASVYGKLLPLIKRHFILGLWVFGSLGLWVFGSLGLRAIRSFSVFKTLRLYFGIAEAFFVKSLRLFFGIAEAFFLGSLRLFLGTLRLFFEIAEALFGIAEAFFWDR